MMEIFLIIAVLWLVGWLLLREKKEDREARLAQQAARAETARLQRESAEKGRAERQREQEAIQRRREVFYAAVFKPQGVRLGCLSAGELNVPLGAWRSYLCKSDRASIPREHRALAERLMAKFHPDKVIRFGDPQTEEEARLRLQQIDQAALLAARRAQAGQGSPKAAVGHLPGILGCRNAGGCPWPFSGARGKPPCSSTSRSSGSRHRARSRLFEGPKAPSLRYYVMVVIFPGVMWNSLRE
jgi:hypothetical protein